MTNPYEADAAWIRRDTMDISDRSHHYIVLKFLHEWLVQEALPYANGRLLDYGSGGQPYRRLFETKVDTYIAADVAVYGDLVPEILLVANEAIPCEDASFDTVLSSQTLEHVPTPDFYIAECARVIKPGGTLIMTAPMQWRHHEVPYDYFRYTQFGLKIMLERHGFTVQSIKSTGGAMALIGQILLNFLSERKVYRPFLYKIINRTALWLDKRYPDGEDVINWMCIAKRVSAASDLEDA